MATSWKGSMTAKALRVAGVEAAATGWRKSESKGESAPAGSPRGPRLRQSPWQRPPPKERAKAKKPLKAQ